MKINRGYRYELKPNTKEFNLLFQHAGTARYAYNWGLSQRIDQYEKFKTTTNAIKQHKQLNILKKTDLSWMYDVSKCSPQEALRDLDKAFKNYFRGIKQGQNIGFPQFRKRGQDDSFRLTGTIKVNHKSVQLPRLGTLRLKEIAKVKGRILSATVSLEIDRWFVSFTVEEEIETPNPIQGDAVGVDVGLKSFAVLSSGEKIKSPKPLAKNLRSLRRCQKSHSRKKKGSKNCQKSKIKLAKKHKKIKNQRTDFLHKITTKLAKTKSVIVIEDLSVDKMKRDKKFSRQISDAGWRKARTMLEYKTKWYGSKLIVVPRYYPSSKKCSSCGTIKKQMPLSVRKWQCSTCLSEHDRDINAAKNLLNYSTGSSSGVYACGGTARDAEMNFAVCVPVKQEVMSGIFVHEL
jgi:putative transposase